LEDYEGTDGIVSEVYSEPITPAPELIEAQRIQIDPDYGMRVRHNRELEKIAETASDEEQLLMARKMDFSILAQAMWEIYSKEHATLEQIRGNLT